MRSLAQITEIIRSAFKSSPVLNELDLDVPASVEYNLIAASATAQYSLEAIWDAKRSELQKLAEASQTYSGSWYEMTSKEFQYGDILIWDNQIKRHVYGYADSSKQIIKYAATAANPGGGVILKVCKESNGPVKLSPAELTAFQGYWSVLNPFTPLGIISADPDLLTLNLAIHFAAIQPLPELKAAVEQAIVTYLNTLEFGGIFRVSRLIDAIQGVQGVVDVVPGVISAVPAGSSAATTIVSEYRAFAGFARVNSATPLYNTLSYQIATR